MMFKIRPGRFITRLRAPSRSVPCCTCRWTLAGLLRFGSNKTEPGRYTSLSDYVTRMPGEQTDIYYLAGESRDLLLQSPYLEGFQAKGWEVLLLTEPIDEFVVQALP